MIPLSLIQSNGVDLLVYCGGVLVDFEWIYEMIDEFCPFPRQSSCVLFCDPFCHGQDQKEKGRRVLGHFLIERIEI